MKIRVQPRQTGKSYDIAQQLKKDKEGIVIVPNKMMKQYFHKSFKISLNRILTITDVVHNPDKTRGANVYIDEIGACLMMFINGNIKYGTHTDF